jgi:hypothetical protein
MNKQVEMAIAVADGILSLFRDEEDGGNPNFHYKLEDIDATEFFTAMVIGCNLVYRQLTKIEKNNLEFTYLCNQLIVQDMLKNK